MGNTYSYLKAHARIDSPFSWESTLLSTPFATSHSIIVPSTDAEARTLPCFGKCVAELIFASTSFSEMLLRIIVGFEK